MSVQTLTASGPLHMQACWDLAQRGRLSGVVYVLVWIMVVISTPVWQEWFALTVFMSLVVALTSLRRMYLIVRFERLFIRAPARWLLHYQANVLVMAWAWGMLTAIMHWFYPLQWTAYLTGFITAGIAAGGAINQSTHIGLQRHFVIALLLPSALVCAALVTLENLVLALAFLVDMFFLLRLGSQLHREYWSALTNNTLLETRAYLLDEARLKAEKADRAKSTFLTYMSHELRTPLNAILGFSQLFEGDKNLSADHQHGISEIKGAGRHLLDLVNDVLDLAQIESGHMELILGEVDLEGIIRECVSLVSPLTEQYQVTLHIDDSAHCPTPVLGNAVRLRQVFVNLLSNAIKYNRPGGTVTISCLELDGHFTRVRVSDSGLGIPEEYQGSIFQAFTRVRRSQHKVEGTGIGLVITKQLIELMGGRIGFDSVEGKGSTFWIDLRCAR